jgi:hypothetical protein
MEEQENRTAKNSLIADSGQGNNFVFSGRELPLLQDSAVLMISKLIMPGQEWVRI